MLQKVIRLHERKQLTPCTFRPTCPVYLATSDVNDPIAAVYSMLTSSGRVLDGAYNVHPDQIDYLLEAIDRLTLQLHRRRQANLFDLAMGDNMEAREE